MNHILNLAERTLTLERNEFLKVGGSIDTNVYYIESGSLKAYVLDLSRMIQTAFSRIRQ